MMLLFCTILGVLLVTGQRSWKRPPYQNTPDPYPQAYRPEVLDAEQEWEPMLTNIHPVANIHQQPEQSHRGQHQGEVQNDEHGDDNSQEDNMHGNVPITDGEEGNINTTVQRKTDEEPSIVTTIHRKVNDEPSIVTTIQRKADEEPTIATTIHRKADGESTNFTTIQGKTGEEATAEILVTVYATSTVYTTVVPAPDQVPLTTTVITGSKIGTVTITDFPFAEVSARFQAAVSRDMETTDFATQTVTSVFPYYVATSTFSIASSDLLFLANSDTLRCVTWPLVVAAMLLVALLI